ncbi:bacterial transferase hexapeptide domain containing protein [Musa troglodytarum]|uniref:Bacterial transferase hexapeptide domain containing protein n=1 Tax=Musa troglodytarum TaxID=320322 RepID=A0A9E7F2K6_9LILI|nr:bacterial transferase hexapeptide domain containing protein [Musa troglodytarum]
MGAVLLDGVVVEKHGMVAAGALPFLNLGLQWTESIVLHCWRLESGCASTQREGRGDAAIRGGMIVVVWGGNPAKFLRKLTEEEVAFISQSATNYTNLAQVHAVENAKSFDEIEFEKVLRKKFARRDEEYDSMLGVVREVPPELILPDNILPDKSPKP